MGRKWIDKIGPFGSFHQAYPLLWKYYALLADCRKPEPNYPVRGPGERAIRAEIGWWNRKLKGLRAAGRIAPDNIMRIAKKSPWPPRIKKLMRLFPSISMQEAAWIRARLQGIPERPVARLPGLRDSPFKIIQSSTEHPLSLDPWRSMLEVET